MGQNVPLAAKQEKMEKSAPETGSAKVRVPGKAMGHAFVIQGPQVWQYGLWSFQAGIQN